MIALRNQFCVKLNRIDEVSLLVAESHIAGVTSLVNHLIQSAF